MSEGISGIQWLWTEGFFAAKPLPTDCEGFSPSDFLLSSPWPLLLPDVNIFLGGDDLSSGSTRVSGAIDGFREA